MSGKIRSVNQQIQHAISTHAKIGMPKRTDKMNPQNETKYIYGLERIEDLRQLARTFSQFLKEHHPEARFAREITSEMVQEYIHERAFLGEGWGKPTALEMVSRFRVLSQLVHQTYARCNDFAAGIKPEFKRGEAIRTDGFTQEQLDALKESFLAHRNSPSGFYAVEIGSRVVLRSAGCAFLRPNCIDLERRIIHVTKEMAKGGRERDIPIQEEDFSFFKSLKERTEGQVYCLGVQPESLNRSVRREMKKVVVEVNGVTKTLSEAHPFDALHAVRKYWTHKRYLGLLAEREIEPASPKFDLDCRAVWEIVQLELGHAPSHSVTTNWALMDYGTYLSALSIHMRFVPSLP